jgi:hypothetical protein
MTNDEARNPNSEWDWDPPFGELQQPSEIHSSLGFRPSFVIRHSVIRHFQKGLPTFLLAIRYDNGEVTRFS